MPGREVVNTTGPSFLQGSTEVIAQLRSAPHFRWKIAAIIIGGYLLTKGSNAIEGIIRNCGSHQLDKVGDCWGHSANVFGAILLALAAGWPSSRHTSRKSDSSHLQARLQGRQS